MRRIAIFLLAIAVAGCTDPAEPEPETAIDEERPTESFGDVVTGPAVGPDLDATTAAAPALIEGEWWRVRFHAYLDGETVEVVRVVADVNEDGYIMGMPHEGWLKEAISFHSPAFGDVNFDLSYNTHNERFEPVRFPIAEGDSWQTSFATAPLTATVTAADEHTATIELVPPASDDPTEPIMAAIGLGAGGPVTLTYDARQHEVVKMESDFGWWEVVEHGYDYEGWVTVPRGEHTAIDYGTFLPASESHTPMPREITVDGGFNRMTMMHVVGSIGETPGQISIRQITPDSTEWLTQMEPTGAAFDITYYETNQPDGTWTVEDSVVGAGFTYSMGIAYHQYDIQLPGGALRSDHSHAVIR